MGGELTLLDAAGIRDQVFFLRVLGGCCRRARLVGDTDHLRHLPQKRFFAKYWDHVADQGDISGTSRFISGGIGGITSQLSIYPVETLKTQLQSSKGPVQGPQALMTTARHMWKVGGMRAYYRGLTVGSGVAGPSEPTDVRGCSSVSSECSLTLRST